MVSVVHPGISSLTHMRAASFVGSFMEETVIPGNV